MNEAEHRELELTFGKHVFASLIAERLELLVDELDGPLADIR